MSPSPSCSVVKMRLIAPTTLGPGESEEGCGCKCAPRAGHTGGPRGMNGQTDVRMVPFLFSPLAEVQALPRPKPQALQLWGRESPSGYGPRLCTPEPPLYLLKSVNKWMNTCTCFLSVLTSHPAALNPGGLVWLVLLALSVLDSRLPWFSQSWPWSQPWPKADDDPGEGSQAGEAGGPPWLTGTSPGSGSLGARPTYQLTQLAPGKG